MRAPWLAAVVLSGCASLGVGGPQEPAYTVAAQLAGVQVRQYGPRLAAETFSAGDADTARAEGWRRLGAYVAEAKLSSVAPLSEMQEAPGQWRLRLFLPGDAAPSPSDPAVALVRLPAETTGVLRFSGDADAVAADTGELVGALEGSAWRPAGAPAAWFYDPPWTPSPLRRNEVAIPVSPK
jgi:hypothetical protein